MGNEVWVQSSSFPVDLARLSFSNYFSPYRVGGENFNIVKLSFIIAAFLSFQGDRYPWHHGSEEQQLDSSVFVGSCYMAAYIRGLYFKSEMLALENNGPKYSEPGTCSFFSCKAYMIHMIFKEMMLGNFLYYCINVSYECKWDNYSKLKLNLD